MQNPVEKINGKYYVQVTTSEPLRLVNNQGTQVQGAGLLATPGHQVMVVNSMALEDAPVLATGIRQATEKVGEGKEARTVKRTDASGDPIFEYANGFVAGAPGGNAPVGKLPLGDTVYSIGFRIHRPLSREEALEAFEGKGTTEKASGGVDGSALFG